MGKKKDISVELIRILACLFVIGIHVQLPSVIDGRGDWSRTFLSALIADAVALFWMVSGFYLFSSRSYGQLWKKTVKSIVIPVGITYVAFFYLNAMLFEGAALGQSLHRRVSDYEMLWRVLKSWNPPVMNLGHLWYVHVHLLLVFLFPVLNAFAQWLDEEEKREKWFLLLSFFFLAFNDISENSMAEFSNHSINAWFPAAIEVMWGHFLYRHREKFANHRRLIPVCLLLYFGLSFVRSMIQYVVYADNHTNFILYWFTSFGLISASSIIVMVITAYHGFIKNWHCDRVIQCLGGQTFYIYIVHGPLILLLGKHGFQNWLGSCLTPGLGSLMYELTYFLIMVGVAFGISLGIVLFLRFCGIVLKKSLLLRWRKRTDG